MREGKLDQRLDRAISAQHRVGQLEEHVRAGVQALVELNPKAGQDVQRLARGRGGRETHERRPFSRASWLDISKRGERLAPLSREEPQISRSGDLRG
jgi:hypothetical protein